MTYLVDTSGVSGMMRDDPNLESWLSSLQPNDRLVICPIIRGEILYGLGDSR